MTKEQIIEVKDASFSYGPAKSITSAETYGSAKVSAFSSDRMQRKTTDKSVFSHITFDIFSDETIAILGENGSGKTTLMRCLIGLLPLTGGNIFVNHSDIRTLPQKALFGQVSYVPQKPFFVPGCTVTEEVLLGLSAEVGMFGSPTGEALKKVRDTLELLGISDLAGRKCDELSGGEFRMVYIARALVSSPKVLMLDEPESGLDFRNRLIVMETLKKLKAQGVTTVFNTHFIDDAFQFADRAVLLHNGQAMIGPVREILTKERIREAFSVETAFGTVSDGDYQAEAMIPYKVI